MDPITHGLTGALIAKAFFSETNSTAVSAIANDWQPPQVKIRVPLLAVTLGAVFPDADIIANFFQRDGMATLEWHRGITHSIPCLPGWAIVLALVFRWWLRHRSVESPVLPRLAMYCGVGVASHIFLDVITSWGTMIWAPFSRQRVTLDWVFIIDFTFTGIVLLPQLLAWTYASRERRLKRSLQSFVLCSSIVIAVALTAHTFEFEFSWTAATMVIAVLAGLLFLPSLSGWGFGMRPAAWCRAGVAALAFYFGACATAHEITLKQVQQFVDARHLQAENLGAIPLPPSILQWEGMIRTSNGIFLSNLRWPEQSAEFRFVPDAASKSFIAAALQLDSVKLYLWFARFPSIQHVERDGQHIVELTDMRFALRRSSLPAPFTYRVIFDSEGKVIFQGWAME